MLFFSGNKRSYGLLFFAIWIMSVTLGCGPKSTEQPVTAAVAEPLEEPPVILANTGDASVEAPKPKSVPKEAPVETIEDSPGDVAETARPKHFHPPKPDPRQLLEVSLESLQAATEEWKQGRIEDAISNLDQAYDLLIDIDDDAEDMDILQEKEDLRYLIAKRIVEVYASRRTVAGDVSKSIPIVMNDHVKREIKSFQGRERNFFLSSYKRSGAYRDMILEELRKEGLPEQLAWLPLIESGFKSRALSRARALGLWQFIPSTGYRYGLSRNQYVDERMDPEKATGAAIKYLIDLHHLFGDWMSALAGYNCGEGRVLRAIKRQNIAYLDDFWDLYDQLPRETARYVPRFLATLAILEDPEKYGFELPELDPPRDFERLEVTKSVRLEDLDKLAGLKKGSFKALNPELRYGVTPEKAYSLRVPSGVFDTVTAGVDKLQRYQLPKDAYVTHRVRRGETLSVIAKRYNSSVSSIVRANRLRSQHRIAQGQRLKIPRKGAKMVAVASNKPTSATKKSNSVTIHRVKRGDSLWRLAKKYNTTVNEIKSLNNLRGNTLSLGQKLKIKQASAVSKTHTVKRGDTLGKIAAQYRVALNDLLRVNNMNRRDKIYPNQKLVVPQ
ncbi:MAG: LysM peptidoglycan-binding domain-containing protein [Acidobacteriota bacterium]|nr:LysM peptidoglycan-binding domain-containing protein [Acidobacteriota bacterium]